MTKLFDEAKITDMSPITRRLDSLLKNKGFTARTTGRIERSGFNHDVNVNQLEYLRGKERVFLITHEPC